MLPGSSGPRKRQGIKLIFELTNLCNFSCVHCIRSEKGPHEFLPLKVFAKVLNEVSPYHNVDYVAFTGGEPTLHPEFESILRLTCEHNLKFGFVTNGWHFQKTIKQLQPFLAQIESVSFSVDGASEETHDSLRQRTGSFRRLMQGMSLCKFHQIPFQINMVVTKTNRSELESMAALASRLGCQALGYAHCQPTPDAVDAGLVLDSTERRQVESEIGELQKIFKLRIYLAGDHYEESLFFQCTQLQMREFNVDYRGYLTACCTLSNYRGGTPDTDVLADLNEVSFYEAHRRLIAKIAEINSAKVERLSKGEATELEQFICTYCLKHYDKVSRLEQVLAPRTWGETARKG